MSQQAAEDATLTAVFFKQLLNEGVPLAAAIPMATSYIQTTLFTRAQNQPPREPWQGDPE